MSEARIAMCEECGKHGRIVLKDGFLGPEFTFKLEAFGLINKGIEMERLSEEEAQNLTQQVSGTELPQSHREEGMDSRLLYRACCYNNVRSKHLDFKLSPEELHKLLLGSTPPDILGEPSEEVLERLLEAFDKEFPPIQ